MTKKLDLLVVGGGAAGLAHAFWRTHEEPALELGVVEAESRPGGWMRTTYRDGFTCELGPQGFRPSDDSDTLMDALGVTDRVVPCDDRAKRRWLAVGGKLHPLPSSPPSLFSTRLLGFGQKLRLFREPWIRTRGPADESFSDFLARRFGDGTRRFAEAFAHGVYGGDADELEMRAAFPMAIELEEAHGSLLRGLKAKRQASKNGDAKPRVKRPLLCSFDGGMSTVAGLLADSLGERLSLDSPVTRLVHESGGWEVSIGGSSPRTVRAKEIVLAIPASAAAQLLEPHDAELASDLAAIRSASVASCYVGAPREAFSGDIDGFGFLAPKGELGPVLGVIHTSSVFPAQAPEGQALFRIMSGGIEYPDEVQRSDEELSIQASAILDRFLGLHSEPTFVHIERARDAIAQYERGHSARMDRLAERVGRLNGLELLGASYRQISVVGQWASEGSHP